MFGKILGIATFPVDIVKDVITLGGSLTDERSATQKKIDFLTGKEEFNREQYRKDIEAIAKAIREIS